MITFYKVCCLFDEARPLLIASGVSGDPQVIFTIASVLGAVACLSSLLLLWACLDSHHPHSLFRRMHLPPIPYGKIITLIYLKVATSHTQLPLSPDPFQKPLCT